MLMAPSPLAATTARQESCQHVLGTEQEILCNQAHQSKHIQYLIFNSKSILTRISGLYLQFIYLATRGHICKTVPGPNDHLAVGGHHHNFPGALQYTLTHRNLVVVARVVSPECWPQERR